MHAKKTFIRYFVCIERKSRLHRIHALCTVAFRWIKDTTMYVDEQCMNLPLKKNEVLPVVPEKFCFCPMVLIVCRAICYRASTKTVELSVQLQMCTTLAGTHSSSMRASTYPQLRTSQTMFLAWCWQMLSHEHCVLHDYKAIGFKQYSFVLGPDCPISDRPLLHDVLHYGNTSNYINNGCKNTDPSGTKSWICKICSCPHRRSEFE
jgi:hypothetical protein